MPRKVITLSLVSLLIVQEGLLFAQTKEVQKLEAVLRDMSGEVERFASNMTEADWDWGQRTDEEVEVDRLRARIRNLPSGTEIAVVVQGGERLEGELESAETQAFALWIKQGSRSPKTLKHQRYDDIESAVLPEWNGWTSIDRLHDMEPGKRIEVLIVDDRRIKGRFSSATTDVLVLDVGKGQTQEFALDEVASVKKQGMHRAAKIAIVGGAVFGALMLAAVWAINALGGV